MVAHFATVGFTCFVLYTAWPGSSLFSWHPTMMCLAVAVGMFEALMVFNKESSLFVNFSRPSKILAHHVLQVFGIVCFVLGFLAIYYNKNLNDKPHFTTWHGILGLITLCIIPGAAVFGNIVKFPALRRFLGIKKSLGALKIYHATGGLVVFTFVMATVMLGLYSSWFIGAVHWLAWYLCLMCLSFMAMTVMNQVVSEYLPRTQVQYNNQPQAPPSKKSKKETKKKK